MARRILLGLIIAFVPISDADASGKAGDESALPAFAIARLGTLRFRLNMRLGNSFASLGFSPDGNTLVASCDAGVRWWDAATGKHVAWFPPSDEMGSAAFSADGKTLVTASRPQNQPPASRVEKRLLQHWEAGTGKLLRQVEIERPGRFPTSEYPRVSQGGRFFLHVSNDKEVIVWDTNTGKVHARVQENINYANSFALTPDGKTLAIVRRHHPNLEGELVIYDLPAGKIRCTISRKGVSHYAPAFSPDGAKLVTASGESLNVWDAVKGELLREIPKVRGMVAFSADGKQMACGDRRGIQLFAWPEFTPVKRLEPMPFAVYGVYALAFSPDGKRLASGHDQVVALWDLTTGKQVPPPDGHQAPVCSLAFSADGRLLASGGDGDGTACIWDIAKREARTRLTGHYRAAASVAFSADGKTLATGDGSPTYQTGGGETHIRLWSLPKGELLRRFPAHLNGVTSLDFAPNGKTLASGGLDARVRLWDTEDGKRLAQERGGDGHHWTQFSRDGKHLLIVDGSGTVSIWRPDMKQRIHELMPFEEQRYVELAALSSDGTRVFAATSGRGRGGPTTWWKWETSTGKSAPAVEISRHPLAVRRCALSPDGRMLAMVGGSGIELWDTESRTMLRSLSSGSGYINTLAFSPDGRTLASGAMNTTILLWDVAKAIKRAD